MVLSHDRTVPGMTVADESYLEPSDLSDEEYLEWAIRFCQEHRIDLFWPGKAAIVVAQNHERFLAKGSQVVSVGEASVLELLKNKAAFYLALNPEIADLPESIPVNSLEEFDLAFALLRSKHGRLCVKPASSVFGLGFRLIDEVRPGITHLLKGVEYQISLDELRSSMKSLESFDTLLVMEYLPGQEWSVDCAASNGKLWCAVQRKKPLGLGYGQVIDNNLEIAGMVERLVAHYALNGIFNIQFKEGVNGIRLLEINARPSGGFGMACQSGANLAKIALQAIQNQIPPPELEATHIAYGRRVAEINTPVILD